MKTLLKIMAMLGLICTTNTYALPNPASVNCVNQQGREMMLADDAGTAGICIFSDHSYCDEWQYFRGECKPGKLYWPEKKIDFKNTRRYCLAQDEQKNTLVVLCRTPRK